MDGFVEENSRRRITDYAVYFFSWPGTVEAVLKVEPTNDLKKIKSIVLK